MRIERRLDSISGRYTCAAAAWPASWIATARVSSSACTARRSPCPTRPPSSPSTRCCQVNASLPSWCAFVSAIEQICSIIAGE